MNHMSHDYVMPLGMHSMIHADIMLACACASYHDVHMHFMRHLLERFCSNPFKDLSQLNRHWGTQQEV